MTCIWCLTAQIFIKHPAIKNAADKYGHIVTPIVLVLLGIYILYESGTWELFFN